MTVETFGELVRNMRQERYYSQVELAYELKISQTGLSAIEKNLYPGQRKFIVALTELWELSESQADELYIAAGLLPLDLTADTLEVRAMVKEAVRAMRSEMRDHAND